jgi:8-oxo-dGTP pyrophosphatase MutT (NUDIX family)
MAILNRVDSIPLGDPIDSRVLNSSLGEFRQQYLSETGQPYDKIVVGAAAIRYTPDSGSHAIPRILLLKRAAHEAYFPGVFELPSGKVDPEDPTIKHALFREVLEETSLEIKKIFADLKPMLYTTEKNVMDDAGRQILLSKKCIQLNYVVSVSDADVKLSVDEHSESTWAMEGDSDSLNVTSAMRAVVEEAFRWAASRHMD